MAIDSKLPIPVYFQLKTLLEEILEGSYGLDGRLPTEHELCARHRISRTPVTRALSELAAEGVVLRHRRAGDVREPALGSPAPGGSGAAGDRPRGVNPGWSPGRWGGFGSVHTVGTWPLGVVQEWVVASLLGDPDRADDLLGRLLADTGAWQARHWFAWPSAVLATLALGTD